MVWNINYVSQRCMLLQSYQVQSRYLKQFLHLHITLILTNSFLLVQLFYTTRSEHKRLVHLMLSGYRNLQTLVTLPPTFSRRTLVTTGIHSRAYFIRYCNCIDTPFISYRQPYYIIIFITSYAALSQLLIIYYLVR